MTADTSSLAADASAGIDGRTLALPYNRCVEQSRISELLRPFLETGVPSREAPLGDAGAAPRDRKSAALSQSQLSAISMYIDILLHWNARMNLTAVRDPESIVTRHFGESLFAAEHLFPAVVGTSSPLSPVQSENRGSNVPLLIDVGSGPGFPGLPIKIWAPAIHVMLIESNHKKATFLREVIRHLNLVNCNVFVGRAEDYASSGASISTNPSRLADMVTLRAVERFESILPVAGTLVAPGGRLCLLIGEKQASVPRMLLPDFEWAPPSPLPLSSTRCLLLGYSPRS
ncbi:MAG TPA: 16S rRNA (guanine(527)-N(7))-methyltransferase RsmG [Terriglobales bacterium]|nr:16S rRNA (guanine(527)-N(7))-methyltransferase RsmG [Terriglobales bacterium]